MTGHHALASAPAGGFRVRVVSGAAVTGAAQGLKLALQLVSVVVLSRLLAPADFGLVAMAAPLIAFMAMFRDLGLNSAVVSAPTINGAQLSTMFWVNVGVSVGITALLVLAAPLAGWFYGNPDVVPIMAALALTIPLAGLSSQHEALVNRNLRFGRLAATEVCAAASGLLAAIAVAWAAPGPWALVASSAAAGVVSLAGLWASSGWRPGRPGPVAGIRSFLHFGVGLTTFNLSNFLSRNLDNVLIERYACPTQLGFDDQAYKLLLFPLSQVNNPIGRVLIPVLSRLVDEPERYRRAYMRTLQQMLMLTLPLVVFLLSSADTLIPFVLGPKWAPSVPIFLWLGLAAIHQPLSATCGWLFISQSRTTEFAQWGAVVAITSIAAFVAGLPWGAVGVAAAYGLSDLLIRMPVLWFWVGRRGPMRTRDLLALAAPNVVANIAAAGVVLMLPSFLSWPPLLELMVRGAVCFGTCWLALAMFPSGRAAFQDTARAVRGLLGRHAASGAPHPTKAGQ